MNPRRCIEEPASISLRECKAGHRQSYLMNWDMTPAGTVRSVEGNFISGRLPELLRTGVSKWRNWEQPNFAEWLLSHSSGYFPIPFFYLNSYALKHTWQYSYALLLVFQSDARLLTLLDTLLRAISARNEELNWFYSGNFITVIKWRRMKWLGHVARIGKRCTQNSGQSWSDKKAPQKWRLKKNVKMCLEGTGCGTDLSVSGNGSRRRADPYRQTSLGLIKTSLESLFLPAKALYSGVLTNFIQNRTGVQEY